MINLDEIVYDKSTNEHEHNIIYLNKKKCDKKNNCKSREDDFSKLQLVKLFIDRKACFNTNTANSYQCDIKNFFKVDNVVDISIEMLKEVSINIVEEYIENLILYRRSSTTINRKLSSLSSLYKWLALYELNKYGNNTVFTSNVFNNTFLREQKVISNKTEFITDLEIDKLMKSIGENDIIDLRDKALFSIMLSIGIGREEITKLKIDDIICFEKKLYLGYKNNTSNENILHELNSESKMLLLKYLECSNRSIIKDGSDYIFKSYSSNPKTRPGKIDCSTINKIFRKRCHSIDINENCKVSSFKYTAYMKRVSEGIDIDKVTIIIKGKSYVLIGKYINELPRYLEDNI